ncbi:MAG: prepilin peptidase [Actinomycetota bacterium]
MDGGAPAWLLVAAGLLGAAVGGFLPRVVRRSSPALHDDDGAPPRSGGSRLAAAVVTAGLYLLVAWHFGPSWQLPAYLFLATVAVVLTVIDLRHHLLPNAVVGPALSVGLLLLALASAVDSAWDALIRAVLGALVLFLLYLALALISPAGLGMGDVKLAAVLGLFLGYQGWGALLLGAVLASVFGALAGLVVLVTRRGGLRSDVPFGPSMLAGALVAVAWGEQVVRHSLPAGIP